MFGDIAAKNGFDVLFQVELGWGNVDSLDCLSLIQKQSDSQPTELTRNIDASCSTNARKFCRDNKTKVAVLLMQKNEGEILQSWVDYYLELFGRENIYIYNNASDDASTIRILDGLKKSGVFITSANNKYDFENKGRILLAHAKRLLNNGYEFAYFADCDEFLVFNEKNIPIFSRGMIIDEFLKLKESQCSLFRIKEGWSNIPRTCTVFKDSYGCKKTILKRGFSRKLKLDVGFHLYDWANKKDIVSYGAFGDTNFGLLHFHNRNYKEYMVHAKEKLKFRVKDFSVESLKSYRGDGLHLIKKMLMNEDDYYEYFRKINTGIINVKYLFDKIHRVIPFSQ